MAAIVIDLGCESHGLDSTTLLIDRFRPDLLYGFDPGSEESVSVYRGAALTRSSKAAWVWDGMVPFVDDGVASCLAPDGLPLLPETMQLAPQPPRPVECFDFSAWLERLNRHEVVLKMDVEGAEYALLEHLIKTGMIKRVGLLLIEWHPSAVVLPCRVETWAY